MSFIAQNPLSIPKIETTPSTPSGTRGLFAKEDGWYDVTSTGKSRKIITNEDLDVYILQEGVDIEVSDGEVVKLINNDYSQYKAIAFPEGITAIELPEENRVLEANKVIFPRTLRTMGESFANQVNFDEQGNIEEDTVKINVKEYVLNEGIEKLENYAFADNVYLEQISIPNTVIKIGRGALQYCENLNKIIIPTSVVEIGDYNFITYFGKKPTIHGYTGSYAETFAKENDIPFVYIEVSSGLLADIANKVAPSPASITIYADRWEQDEVETRWHQEVVVANATITPASKVDLQLSAEQITIFYEKDLAFVTENEDGVVTVFCIGQKPENDYIIQATVSEVVVNG